MVTDIAEYEWSSYKQHVGLEADTWIDSDPAYQSLSNNAEERIRHYKNYVNQTGLESETNLITSALQRGQLTGTHRFTEEVEQRLGLRVEHRGPGRPRRMKK